MAKNLVIVESPAKAKTIGQYLGSDFEVESSYGHVRDLPKKQMGVDIKKHFDPEYIVPDDKQKTVAKLKQAAKKASVVWLATDEDREGEAIAWHLSQALDLKPIRTKRIGFHEITKTAIADAIASPRTINQNLVDAQQARRVLDRLVGYELSPVLWRKIRRGLSAGRVQSVAVRLIVEREREIGNFKPGGAFKVTAQFKASGSSFEAELDSLLKDKPAAKAFLEGLKKASYSVKAISQKPATKSPPPPLTTSSLQQAAASNLGFSVRQTMVLAQKLYEAGHITYMRTDSLNLAESALAEAGNEIKSRFGDRYHQLRRYQTQSKLAQEAHEAIRPTHFKHEQVAGDPRQSRLYQLIWARSLASQMAAAKIERTNITIAISNHQAVFKTTGEVLLFDGWLKVLRRQADDRILPSLANGQKLVPAEITATETPGKPKPRYTEASLVKKLEHLGIGRPSTYAPIISTIQGRGYVEKIDHEGKPQPITSLSLKDGQIKASEQAIQLANDKGKLSPTEIGEVVTDFLVKHAAEIMDYQFTAKVEDDFDEIAQGHTNWRAMLADFYPPFHKTVEKSQAVSRQEASQMRKLGLDPATKKPIFARLARFGPVFQVGEASDDEKPRFIPIPKQLRLDEVSLADALPLLKLPRALGQDKTGQMITADIGPYGPYVRAGSLAVSLGEIDPLKVSLKEAIALVKAKQRQKAKALIKSFKDSPIQLKNGPYGPYVTDGKLNAPLPKDAKPAKISLQKAQALLVDRGKQRRFRAKKT